MTHWLQSGLAPTLISAAASGAATARGAATSTRLPLSGSCDSRTIGKGTRAAQAAESSRVVIRRERRRLGRREQLAHLGLARQHGAYD
jgi:hypothetical protein